MKFINELEQLWQVNSLVASSQSPALQRHQDRPFFGGGNDNGPAK
jgi:hypothetical protein